MTGEEHAALCRLRDSTDDSILKRWLIFIITMFESKEAKGTQGFVSPQGMSDKVTLSVQRKQDEK